MPKLDPYWIYKRPGRDKAQLQGLTWNDERFAEGTFISTTSIVERNKTAAKTRSGTTYLLGRRFKNQDEAVEAGVIERDNHLVYVPGPNFDKKD